MGTNFYIHKEHKHIGKRSAAGLYCWDCQETLCRGDVHSGAAFYDYCPRCSQAPLKEDLNNSAAGRELGFNKSIPIRKQGVQSCSSFSWAIEPSALEGTFDIEDEYGTHYTQEEFVQVLEECPIQFKDSIGREFF